MTEPFTTYERLETCERVEVTMENLPILAQYFGGEAIYRLVEGHWQNGKPRLCVPGASVIEVGAWVDPDGRRWNPEPLTQGWNFEGTYTRTDTQAVTR